MAEETNDFLLQLCGKTLYTIGIYPASYFLQSLIAIVVLQLMRKSFKFLAIVANKLINDGL